MSSFFLISSVEINRYVEQLLYHEKMHAFEEYRTQCGKRWTEGKKILTVWQKMAEGKKILRQVQRTKS